MVDVNIAVTILPMASSVAVTMVTYWIPPTGDHALVREGGGREEGGREGGREEGREGGREGGRESKGRH